MESAGFKEWAIVCQALGRGEQSIILRKGGLAEGRGGFSFRREEFFLFPTYFHEQVEKVRTIIEIPAQVSDKIEINVFAKIELTCVIKSWEIAQALEPFHILQPEVVRERFDYDRAPGLHVAFVRVFRIEPSWVFANAKSYGGCRSWVELPKPSAILRLEPVLGDAEHQRRRMAFSDLVRADKSAPAQP